MQETPDTLIREIAEELGIAPDELDQILPTLRGLRAALEESRRALDRMVSNRTHNDPLLYFGIDPHEPSFYRPTT